MSAGLLVFPIENVRLRVESQFVVHHRALYSGWWDCIQKVWKNEGIRGFYTGIKTWSLMLPVELLWPLVSWQVARAIVYLVYEDDGDDSLDEIRKQLPSNKGKD